MPTSTSSSTWPPPWPATDAVVAPSAATADAVDQLHSGGEICIVILQGGVCDGITWYKGFAAPPVGEMRQREPQPVPHQAGDGRRAEG